MTSLDLAPTGTDLGGALMVGAVLLILLGAVLAYEHLRGGGRR